MSRTQHTNRYDVVVIGAGHAGCEAALAAARAGCRTIVLTPNLDRVGFMPCNPSIGGPGKSHLVAEIDALGGEMARAADRAVLQVRCLNTSKGPAVRAIRAQEDKTLYAIAMKEALEQQPLLDLCQDEVVDLTVEHGSGDTPRVTGVITRHQGTISAAAVVVTAGTFLRGAMISGTDRTSGARAGDRADLELSSAISGSGFRLRRLKTGTPPRIDARTVDFRTCESQPGSETPLWLSRDGAIGDLEPLVLAPMDVLRGFASEGWRPQLSCFQISTNPATHDVIRANLHLAPMFNGSIEGIGPRYCPSIEDKVARFGDKPSHPIYLEPEGWRTTELYVQGMSTSLPSAVQEAALRTIPALRDVRITRYGYAVEYDAVDPEELYSTLETRRIESLFFAGQINGTSGYEEAAAQGIMAGINAAASVSGRPKLVLRRDQAYIGVMIDDLVSKPFDEPYRMLTSRAEFRLSLRPSTADARLAEIAAEHGLITSERLACVRAEVELTGTAVSELSTAILTTSSTDEMHLTSVGIEPLTKAMSAVELLRRPEVRIDQVLTALSRSGKGLTQSITPRVRELVEEEIKYGAFVQRERREVERRHALEHHAIPDSTDFQAVPGLRFEATAKLIKHRPSTIGEASRLSGVTPSDIAALLIHATRAEASAS